MSVPLVDLKVQYDQIRDEVHAAIDEVLEATAYIGGTAVSDFERAFATACGTTHCIGVANGTDAIELALRALGVGPGDRVLMPANTFIATAGAAARTGATPLFVDVDARSALMCPDQLRRAVRRLRPKVIVPVHLYGQIAPMAEIMDIAAEHGCAVVEDAAQSQGARQRGVPMGGWGSLTATSFYPGKNLGAFGDAGAVVTDDDDLAERVRLLANHGSKVRYQHEIVGMNSRLDALQAVVLRIKLERLEAWNKQRADAAAFYAEALGGDERIVLPTTAAGNDHVWHLYVIQLDERDRVLAALQAAGVGAAIHYPVPLHLTPAFAHLGGRRGEHPVAEAMAERILSLPLFPGITVDQQSRVAEALRAALS